MISGVRRALAHYPSGHAYGDSACGDFATHQGASADDRAVANPGAGHHHGDRKSVV